MDGFFPTIEDTAAVLFWHQLICPNVDPLQV